MNVKTRPLTQDLVQKFEATCCISESCTNAEVVSFEWSWDGTLLVFDKKEILMTLYNVDARKPKAVRIIKFPEPVLFVIWAKFSPGCVLCFMKSRIGDKYEIRLLDCNTKQFLFSYFSSSLPKKAESTFNNSFVVLTESSQVEIFNSSSPNAASCFILEDGAGGMTGMTLHSNNKTLMLYSLIDKMIKFFDISRVYDVHQLYDVSIAFCTKENIDCIQFSPCGKMYFVSCKHQIFIFDATNSILLTKCILPISSKSQNNPPHIVHNTIQFSNDSNFLFAGLQEGKVLVWAIIANNGFSRDVVYPFLEFQVETPQFLIFHPFFALFATFHQKIVLWQPLQ